VVSFPVANGSIRIDRQRAARQSGEALRPLRGHVLLKVKARLGLQDSDEVSDVNVGFILVAFTICQLAFIALFCQFRDARLRYGVGLQFSQRPRALSR
jgi:hypothetical protein